MNDAHSGLRARLQRSLHQIRSQHLQLRELDSEDPFTFEYHLRAKYPVKAKTPASRVYLYYEPDVRDETIPVELTVTF